MSKVKFFNVFFNKKCSQNSDLSRFFVIFRAETNDHQAFKLYSLAEILISSLKIQLSERKSYKGPTVETDIFEFKKLDSKTLKI